MWSFLVVFIVTLIVATNAVQVPFGCYEENSALERFPNASGKVDSCINLCERMYFRYAVLAPNDCACSDAKLSKELDLADCNINCSKDPDKKCGGSNGAQSYYDTDVRVPGPSTNLRLANHSSTSVTIQWNSPEQRNGLVNYLIKAKVLETYASGIVEPPQWISQKEDTQFELVDLHPATTYNITLISRAEKEEGGRVSLIVKTDIGVPDQEPEQPKIISRTDETLTVEIKPTKNNNGPVSWYQVIVIFVDSELVQTFDEHLLTNYKQAQDDGTNYYIAAELELQNRTRTFTIGDGRTYHGFANPPLPKNNHVHIAIGIISILDNITKARYGLTSHEQHDVVIVAEKAEDDGQLLLISLVCACIIFGLLLVFSIMVYFYLRIRMERRLQRLPSDHHELTLQVPMTEAENNGYIPDDYLKGNFEEKLNSLLEQIDGAKKFPRNSLNLDINNLVGSGNFGDVIRGNLQRNRCQVHVISDDMEPLDQAQFIKEFEQILKLSSHKNLLNFLGICQTSDWLYVIFEDTPFTLKQRLIEARVTPNVDPNRFSTFSEEFVLRLLCELSNAMEYLAMHQFIHKKICSYNVRVTAQDEVKISGFGATPFDEQGKIVDLSRWMAPEVLRFKHYSDKSDIWSFGCLMWECCSLGGTLYSSVNTNDLVQRIKNGSRPEQSAFMYDDIYQLMLNCWELDPSERPTFAELTHGLHQLLTSPHHVLSFNRRDGVLLPYYLPHLECEN